MAIVPFNFENQTISSAGMAAVNRALLTDGILHGCAVSYSGSNANIAAGRINIGGYVFRLSATYSQAVPTSQNRATIVAKLDLGQVSSETEFAQIQIRAEAGDYTPIQSDLDAGSGSVYELVLAKVAISGGNVTGVTYTAPSARMRIVIGSSQPSGDWTVWLKPEA